MGKGLKGLPGHWSGKDCLEFYSGNRRRIADLYDSEKVFLPRILKKGMKVLDVGCAAGGFCNIMRQIGPDIIYYGCDYTEELIRKAIRDHRRASFVVADSVKLPFHDNYFDLVNCAGTCHMIPDYFEAITEIYRVSGRFSVFDVRLTDKEMDSGMIRCHQKLCFNNNSWDGISISPYIILNGKNFLRKLLKDLRPKPKSVYAAGYLRPPAASVATPLNKLCMAVFMIEKPERGHEGRTEICMDLPYDYMNCANFKNEVWFVPSKLYDRIRQR